jgi:hypothetical protein
VLDLGQAERLQHRRHVVAEATAKALLQPVPPADRVLGRAAPCLDGALCRGLLLVGVAERHPVAVLGEHRVEVLDAAQVVAQLGAADVDDQRRRIGRLVAVGRVIGLARRRGQLPGIARRSCGHLGASSCSSIFVTCVLP